MAFLVLLYRGYERHLVLRPPASLTSVLFSSEIGVIHFNASAQDGRLFPELHDLHKLVLDSPCRTVAYADQTLEFERRYVVLGLGEEVDGLEPYCQSEFGRVEDGVARESRFGFTGSASIGSGLSVIDYRIDTGSALRADEPHRPAHSLDSRDTLLFCSI